MKLYLDFMHAQDHSETRAEWEKAVARLGEQIPIFGDLNHDRNSDISSIYFVHHGIGVRLNGQVFKRNATGWSRNFDWWVGGNE